MSQTENSFKDITIEELTLKYNQLKGKSEVVRKIANKNLSELELYLMEMIAIENEMVARNVKQ